MSCYDVGMIQSFKNMGTEDIFNGENTKVARKICPTSIWKVAARKLDQIDSVVKPCQVIEKANTVSVSMTSIVFVLFGQKRVLIKLRSLIITRSTSRR